MCVCVYVWICAQEVPTMRLTSLYRIPTLMTTPANVKNMLFWNLFPKQRLALVIEIEYTNQYMYFVFEWDCTLILNHAWVVLSNLSNFSRLIHLIKWNILHLKRTRMIEYTKWYRSDTVKSKSFGGKVLLWIKWKFELHVTVHFKHEMIRKHFTEMSQKLWIRWNLELTVFELTVADL